MLAGSPLLLVILFKHILNSALVPAWSNKASTDGNFSPVPSCNELV